MTLWHIKIIIGQYTLYVLNIVSDKEEIGIGVYVFFSSLTPIGLIVQ
jgi:hypothetical protein